MESIKRIVKGFFRFLFRFICKLVPAVFGLALVLLIVAVPFVTTSNGVADETKVMPEYFAKDINIDGTHYDNYFLEKPIMEAHGELYVPATEQMLGILGIEYRFSGAQVTHYAYKDPWNTPFKDTAALWLKKSRSESTDARDLLEFKLSEGTPAELSNSLVTNLRAYTTITNTTDLMITKVDEFGGRDPRNGWDRMYQLSLPAVGSFALRSGLDRLHQFCESSADPVQVVSEYGEELFFDADGLLYFSTEFLEMLGLDCSLDALTGLYISTRSGVSAESLFDGQLAKRIDVLSDYILGANKTLDKDTAIRYEYIFRHEANVTGVDELVIMSVARVESNFRAEAKGSGTVGMMQPLKRYAINYGYDENMLLNPHYNVELCSKYLMDRMHMFDGEERMLVAYNSGPAAVRAGRRSSDYSRKVLKIKNAIIAKLEE